MPARRHTLSWMVLLGGFVCAGAAGCKVNVDVGFSCEDGDKTYLENESFDEGCNRCTCQADGTVTCVDQCVCNYLDVTVPAGAEFDAGDGCNVCRCLEDGSVACSESECFPCKDEPPPCADPSMPGCGYQAECNAESGAWECIETCECDGMPWPECGPAPEGCFFDTYCMEGRWECGELICEGPCMEEPPICEQPPDDPNCYFQPYCTEAGQWDCELVCEQTCGDPVPDCPPEFTLECTDVGWECFPINQTCPDIMEDDCPPSVNPECVVYSTCHADGTWQCQEDCPSIYCQDPEITCSIGECDEYPVCTQMGWACAESCF